MIFVVEGKHDYNKLKEIIPNANIILTNGSAITNDIITQIKQLSKTNEIMLILDPDFAGEKIRRKITQYIPQANHIYLEREKAFSKNKKKIGLEHVTKEYLLSILKCVQKPQYHSNVTIQDLMDLGLIGKENSSKLRKKIGDYFHIGYGNGKQFCAKLNMFNITLEKVKEQL